MSPEALPFKKYGIDSAALATCDGRDLSRMASAIYRQRSGSRFLLCAFSRLDGPRLFVVFAVQPARSLCGARDAQESAPLAYGLRINAPPMSDCLIRFAA